MTHHDSDTTTDRLARAICAEQCAFYGEPACHRIGPWPNPNCNDPGCIALAMAAAGAKAREASNG